MYFRRENLLHGLFEGMSVFTSVRKIENNLPISKNSSLRRFGKHMNRKRQRFQGGHFALRFFGSQATAPVFIHLSK